VNQLINNIGELVGRLTDEADSLEDCGNSELACGVLAAIRIIREQFSDSDQIGGDTATVLDSVDHERVEALEAQLAATELEVSKLAGQLHRLRGSMGAIEANRHLAAEYGGKLALSYQGYKVLEADVKQAENGIHSLPSCKGCRGKGSVKPFLYEYECEACGGTGCDVEHPEMIVKQQALIRTQKTAISKLLHELYVRGISAAEKESISVEAFYADCKTNMRCD
jgi:hypothetical protein